MNVFESRKYQSLLKKFAQEERGNLSVLAKATGCQSSYVLRVINEEAHLTPDQTHRLCKFWGLEAAESEYLMTMVNWARASDREYREELQKKLEELIHEHDNLQRVVQRDDVSEVQKQLSYHADWRICLIHYLTACSRYQSKEKLAARAGLSGDQLESFLDLLSEYALVANDKKAARFKDGIGHIPRNSPVFPIFQGGWRQAAVQRSLLPHEQSVHFTNVQTIAVADIPKLIEAAKRFAQSVKEICESSGDEEVVAMNLDVFVP